jgi:integrase
MGRAGAAVSQVRSARAIPAGDSRAGCDDVPTGLGAVSNFQRNTNSPGTVDYYQRNLKVHVWSVAEFSDKPLKLIGATDVSNLFGPLRQRGHQAQAAHVRRIVSAVFNWARGERGADGEYLITDNPVSRTKPVKIDRPEDGIEPFTAAEARKIIAAAKPGWERRIVTVSLGAGLRPNECFGLKRANVDLGARVIRIRQTYSLHGQVASRTSARGAT